MVQTLGRIIILTLDEWRRLAKVTRKEKEKAIKKLQRWMHHEIIYRGFNQNYGPFSKGAIGGDAVDIISYECLESLFCGEWHWKPTRELSSQLIQIAKSKMGHIIENYYKNGEPEMTLTSDQSFCDEMEMNLALASQWKLEANMRDMGYDIARDVVRDDPQLTAYLNAMFKIDNYYGIASLMGVDVKEVLKLEKKLLARLSKH